MKKWPAIRKPGTNLGTHLIIQEQLITKWSKLGINQFANSLLHSSKLNYVFFVHSTN